MRNVHSPAVMFNFQSYYSKNYFGLKAKKLIFYFHITKAQIQCLKGFQTAIFLLQKNIICAYIENMTSKMNKKVNDERASDNGNFN